MAQINVALDDETKEQWEQYVDEHPDFRYITHLVRAAVGEKITGRAGNGGINGDVAERLSDIESVILKVDGKLDDTNERLDKVENQLEGPSQDITDLTGDVFDVLPTEELVGRVSQDVLSGDSVPVEDGTVLTGRIEDMADFLGEDRIRVRQAVQQLEDDTPLVDTTVVGGETRFYRSR